MRDLRHNPAATKLPGTWRSVAPAMREFWKAIVCCPGCAFESSLRCTHDVGPDGTVTPSLVCPGDGCSFHDHVRLAGWAEQDAGANPGA